MPRRTPDPSSNRTSSDTPRIESEQITARLTELNRDYTTFRERLERLLEDVRNGSVAKKK
jgi:hypothetical protein